MKDNQKRKEFMGLVRGLKAEEFASELREHENELFWLRFKSKQGQAEGPSRIRKVRRALARLKTVQNERKDIV